MMKFIDKYELFHYYYFKTLRNKNNRRNKTTIPGKNLRSSLYKHDSKYD